MSEKTDKFISEISKYAMAEMKNRNKWILPSVCIAQAALESGWNLDTEVLFGIKGAGSDKKFKTVEYVDGKYIEIEDHFVTYPNVAEAVKGYYDFITTTPRYWACVNEINYIKCVNALIYTSDGAPYATDPDYIDKIISIIEDFDLTRFDYVNYLPYYKIGDYVKISLMIDSIDGDYFTLKLTDNIKMTIPKNQIGE